MSFTISHLEQLEAESISILRDIAAEFERPVMLYSVGKDSSVLLHLAKKAFHPMPIPFPILHVDTGYKFREMYEFRDKIAKALNLDLIVYRNEDAIGAGTSPKVLGTIACCKRLKTDALLSALKIGNYSAAIGGARRDEEKSRAKERIFSFRDKYGQWDPRKQRPELWNLYNGRINTGESIRAFPISNWTELDVWEYIKQESIDIVPLYFAKLRNVYQIGKQLIPEEGFLGSKETSKLVQRMSRFRTLGCSPCTGIIPSEADTIDKIIAETRSSTLSERSTRVIDHDADGSMEMKKREGYF